MTLRKSIRLCPLLLALLTPSSCWSAASPYALDWIQFGFLDQRDYADGVVVNSVDEPVVGGSSGPIYGTDSTNLGGQGALIAKYHTNGQLESISMAYPNQNSLDHVTGIAVDGSDNVFIAGETYRYPSAAAYLVKFNDGGSVQWERHINFATGAVGAFGRDVAVDGIGNVYVLGSTTGSLAGAPATGYDPFIAKYSPAGDLLWLRQYADNSLSEIPVAIAVTQSGIYMAGPRGVNNSVLTHVDADGNILGSTSLNYATLPGQGTQIYDITSDSQGNVYTCGLTDTLYNNSLGFQGADAVIAKHGPGGALLWQRRLETGEFDFFSSLQIDAFGDVYVAGTKTNSASIIVGDYDALWAKFDSDGNLLWQDTYETDHDDAARGIAVDSHRNVYVTGWSTWTVNDYYSGEGDAFLIRYNYVVPEPQSFFLAVGFAFLLGWRRHPAL